MVSFIVIKTASKFLVINASLKMRIGMRTLLWACKSGVGVCERKVHKTVFLCSFKGHMLNSIPELH